MPNTVQYPKGAVIFFEGKTTDKIFILKDGSVTLTHTDPDTKEVVKVQINNGEFFGVKYTLIGKPNANTATAVTESTVITITPEEFENLVKNDQQLMFKMLRAFSAQVTQFHKQLSTKFNIEKVTDYEKAMLDVAKSFFDVGEFQQCIDVCEQFLAQHKDSAKCGEASEMIEKSREAMEVKAEDAKNATPEKEDAENSQTVTSFDILPDAIPYLPDSFKRFEKIYEPGRVIISEFDTGDNFYLVQSGVVRLTKYLNGRNTNVAVVKPGDFFGLHELLSEEVHSATCITASKVKVLEFTKENFEPVVTSIPQTAIMLLKLFSRMVNDDRRMFKNFCIQNMQMRISDMFLMFDEMGMGERLNTRSVKFYMSAHDVAQWLALSDEDTKAKLQQLETLGQIKVEENIITVIDINDLRRVVETHVK